MAPTPPAAMIPLIQEQAPPQSIRRTVGGDFRNRKRVGEKLCHPRYLARWQTCCGTAAQPLLTDEFVPLTCPLGIEYTGQRGRSDVQISLLSTTNN